MQLIWLRNIMLKRFAKKALLVWAAFAFIMGATLMAGHWVILPAPAKEDQSVAEELLQLAQDPKRDLLAVHILYSRCKCSKRILGT